MGSTYTLAKGFLKTWGICSNWEYNLPFSDYCENKTKFSERASRAQRKSRRNNMTFAASLKNPESRGHYQMKGYLCRDGHHHKFRVDDHWAIDVAEFDSIEEAMQYRYLTKFSQIG